jgi:hypothetical protein
VTLSGTVAGRGMYEKGNERIHVLRGSVDPALGLDVTVQVCTAAALHLKLAGRVGVSERSHIV